MSTVDVPQPARSTSCRFSLRTMLIVVAISAIVFGGIRRDVKQSREATFRRSTATCFTLVALALANFNDGRSRLPPPARYADRRPLSPLSERDANAQPLCSWRFEIIPYVASYKKEAKIDVPWNAPSNASWGTVPTPYAYGAWGDPATIVQDTNGFAIIGPGTAFGDGETERPARLGDLDDDTILIIEVRDSGVHWMEPGDFDIRTMPRTINAPDGRGISSRHPGGFHVAFADGTVWFLGNDVPFETLEKFFTVAGAKANNRDELLARYRAY